jgi:hypothetical protein
MSRPQGNSTAGRIVKEKFQNRTLDLPECSLLKGTTLNYYDSRARNVCLKYTVNVCLKYTVNVKTRIDRQKSKKQNYEKTHWQMSTEIHGVTSQKTVLITPQNWLQQRLQVLKSFVLYVRPKITSKTSHV